MGVIIRQSIKSYLISLLAIVIGFASVIFVAPLNPDKNGFINNIISISLFISTLFSFGAAGVPIKFFSNHANLHQLVRFVLILILLTFIFIICGLFFMSDLLLKIIALKGFNTTLFTSNTTVIVALGLLMCFNALLTNLSSLFKRIVVPNLVNNLLLKIFLIVLVLANYYNIVNSESIPITLLGFYLLSFLILLLYYLFLFKKNRTDIVVTKEALNKKKIIYFHIISGSSYLSYLIAYKLDTVFVGGLLDYKSVSVYLLPLAMAQVLDILLSTVTSISSPIVSKALNENRLDEIATLNKKSSINLFIIGLFIFFMILLNYNELITLTKKKDFYGGTIWVFIFLGVGKLVDIITGINNVILSYSKYYYYNLIFIVILAIVNITMSFKLIPEYGLVGAAISSFSSITLFNILKLLFIYYKYRIQPFSLVSIKILLVGGLLYAPISFILIENYPLISIIIKCILFSGFFIFLTYKLNLSEEINGILRKKIKWLQ